ncbi:hypothetical protein SGLAM104S_05574 [Streptomyces glaucescens]
MTRHQRTQRARGSRDQDRALTPDRTLRRRHRHDRLDTRHVDDTVADRELGLVPGEHGVQRVVRPRPAVVVQEDEPAGVLRLGRPQQAPDRGGRQVLDTLLRAGRHRTPRDQHQPRQREPLVRQPALHQLQGPVRGLVRRPDRVPVRRRHRERDEHRIRQCPAVVDGGDQVRQVCVDGRPGRETGHGIRPAYDRPHALRVVGRGSVRQRRPLDAEEGVTRPGCARELLGGKGTQDERVDRGDGRSGAVGDGHRHRVRAHRRQPHPQHRRTRRVQRHTTPLERQPRPAVGEEPTQPHTVQRRIQQRRMQTKTSRILPLPLRQLHLGEHLVTEPPGRTHPLEHRPIAVPVGHEPLVQALDIHRHGPGRRPHHQLRRTRRRRRTTHRQHTRRMTRPGALRWCVLPPGIHGERPTALHAGLGHRDPQLHPALFGQCQRGLEDQFLDHLAAHLVTGAHGQFHEGGTRQQHHTVDRVIRQPRMRPQRQPTGQHHAGRIRKLHRRPEHRVLRRHEPEPGQRTGRRDSGAQPVVAALEGVRRQVDVVRVRAGEDLGPVDVDAVDPQLTQGGQEAVQAPVGRGAGCR